MAPTRARAEVAAAIDRMVWYAGWADKFVQIYGNLNPVAGPFFNISSPEPTGVVGVIAPETPALLGLVSRLAPVIVTGNTAVLVASSSQPLAGDHVLQRSSRLPTCPPGWSTSSPATPLSWRPGWPTTWTSTQST